MSAQHSISYTTLMYFLHCISKTIEASPKVAPNTVLSKTHCSQSCQIIRKCIEITLTSSQNTHYHHWTFWIFLNIFERVLIALKSLTDLSGEQKKVLPVIIVVLLKQLEFSLHVISKKWLRTTNIISLNKKSNYLLEFT